MMSTFSRHFVFVSIILLHTAFACAQTPVKLDARARTEIIRAVSKQLTDNYVFPDTAARMSALINMNLRNGAYNQLTIPADFSDRVLHDLQSVYNDRHLVLEYNPAFGAAIVNTRHTGTTDDPDRRVKAANYGFKKTEILNGNIGYINMNRCWAGKTNGGLETMKAVLQYVAHTNAVIIDLRENSGGSQETVTLLIGYFLNRREHLETFYDRASDTQTAFLTEVDSSFTAMANKPLYILTGSKTFSAGEMLAYDLQALKRATIIGEVTGGAAHGEFETDVTNGFVLHVPYWRGVNTITKTNWEQVGLKPDIAVPADKALEEAEMKIFETLVANAKNESELFNLNWELDLLKAVNHPAVIDTATLKRYAGVYGERTFTFENGKLFYQRTGKPKFEMEPMMTPNMMKAKGNAYFKIEFVANEPGVFDLVNAYYQDNRKETSLRNK